MEQYSQKYPTIKIFKKSYFKIYTAISKPEFITAINLKEWNY